MLQRLDLAGLHEAPELGAWHPLLLAGLAAAAATATAAVTAAVTATTATAAVTPTAAAAAFTSEPTSKASPVSHYCAGNRAACVCLFPRATKKKRSKRSGSSKCLKKKEYNVLNFWYLLYFAQAQGHSFLHTHTLLLSLIRVVLCGIAQGLGFRV